MFRNRIKIEWVIIFVGITVLLPFLILSFYNHPAGDDYSYASLAHKYGFWKVQIWWYNHWVGCLNTSFWMSMSPLMIKSFVGYKIVTFIMILFIISSIYLFINTAFSASLQQYQKWAIVFAFVISYLYYIPSVDQGFYWMNNVVAYKIPTILTLILLSLLIKLRNKTLKYKTKFLPLVSLLVILIMQGVETYMVFMFGFTALLLIISIAIYKKYDRVLMLLWLVAIPSAIVVLLSPGIYIRQGYFPVVQGSVFDHITTALLAALGGTFSLLFKKSLIIIILSFVLLPVFDTALSVKKDMLPIVHPFVAFFIVLILPTIVHFPSCWLAWHMPAPGRVPNIAYFYFLMGWLYFMFCTWAYLKEKYNKDMHQSGFKKAQWILLGVVIGVLFLQNNIRAAYGDLIIGRAAQYDRELTQRYEMIEKCNSDTCIVPPLTVHPASLWSSDITVDPKDGDTRNYGIFFGKKTIRLSEPEEESL